MAKADELAIKLGISGFSCGYGWLHRFKQRHSIVWQGREQINKIFFCCYSVKPPLG